MYLVSAYTQVKMEDAHKLLKIPKSECPDIRIRLPRHKWPTSLQVWKTQLFLLNGICTVLLWQHYYGKGNLRRSYWSMAGRKLNWECLSLYIVIRIFLICVCGWHKIGWKENLDPMWKVRKEVDFGEPTSFLSYVNLGCTQRQCEISK